MPFAIIAVALLVLASAYCVVATQVKDSEESAENIVTELVSIDKAIDNTRIDVDKGLGEIIYSISVDPDGGTLDLREAEFEARAEEWMDNAFPRNYGGVIVTLGGYETEMIAVPLKTSTYDSVSEGFTPSYLKATGSFDAEYVSDSGSAARTTEISTDGSCALPLVAEQGSLFDSMISGDGSVLAQMMTYQLTALAQYRVLNGYGSMAEYGSMGTTSILTSEDVIGAYRSALNVIETLTFRTSPEGGLGGNTKADLADLLVAEGGHVEMDVSAMYSQALVSVADDLALKWVDYFYGNIICNAVDLILDNMSNAIDSLAGFLTGKDGLSAAAYIDSVMSGAGYDKDRYRYLMSGKSFGVNVPSGTVAAGGGELSFDGFGVSVPYPKTDLMSWGGISKFKSDYRAGTNELRELFREIIVHAAVDIGQSKPFGTIRFSVDAYDDEAFMDTISRMVSESLDGGVSDAENIMVSAIGSQAITDPFYAKIYEVISNNAYAIYGVSTFEGDVRKSLEASVSSELDKRYGTVLDTTVVPLIVDGLMASDAVKSSISGYRAAVDEVVGWFSALNRVPGGQSGLIKDMCVAIVKGGLAIEDKLVDIPSRIKGLCEETAKNMDVNAYYGLTELPDSDRFVLTDGSGNVSIEKLSLTHSFDPKVIVGGPNDNLSDNIHYVGFNDRTGASYGTAFSVRLTDALSYVADGAGTLEDAMGSFDSSMRGSAEVDLDLKIVVQSGWALAGVKDYRASNTFLADVWNVMIKLLEPLLEPLRKIVSMIMDALSILNSALMKLSKYAAKIVETLYRVLMDPLEQIKSFIEDKLSGLFDSVLEKAVESVQTFIGIDLSKQSVGFAFMGFTITFTTKMSTWVNNTKTLLTVELAGKFDKLSISGHMTIKQRGSGSAKEMLLTGGMSVEGKDWSVKADIDPAMKTSGHMISMSGTAKGVKFDIVLPDLVQYMQAEFSLCDVPALSEMLSNIPLPIAGLKASVDAGINLKYNIPFETGVLVNEFELNPEGEDKDHEWVELYNATYSSVDLEGYTISASSGPDKKIYTITGLTLTPKQREVIYLPGSFLNNAGSTLLSSGEYVMLKSPDGETVDKTPAKKDSTNNADTWQRAADGAMDWVFAPGSPGGSNGGGVLGGNMMKAQLLNIFKESAVKTMGKFGTLKSVDNISTFFKIAIQDAITTAIEMLANMLIEASIFISIDIADATSTVCAGMRVALFIDSGLIEEGLKYLVGEIESLLFNMENPYGLNPKMVVTENVYLGVTVYTGIKTPKFLRDLDAFPQSKIGVHVSTNVAGLTRLAGKDTGVWKVTAGVLIMDCPPEILPSVLSPDKTLDADLWLVRATFVPA
ncbi:MAG: lamin tail domain-containing protein [Candidatus Methanoplasma sp.]|jgi:hypothetical protein|nr:lamin tail domain-containing protein [Candidatus Methanoplasma sp.]